MRKLCAALLPLLFVVAGCGDPNAPPMGTVSGTVTVGGQPPTEPFRIVFSNSTTGQGSAGEVEEDGGYELETPLPVGEYQVYFIMSNKMQSDAPRSTDAEIVKSIPRQYQSESSPLTEAVAEGSNTIDVDVPAE